MQVSVHIRTVGVSGSERSRMEVRGLVITCPRKVEEWTLSVPLAVSSEVGVRIELCGLCTPEQRVYRGAKPTYPYWGGHELSGTIVSLPDDVPDGLRVGDRVAVLLMRRCGQCRACRLGLDNHCAYLNPKARGGVPQGPGGLANFVGVPAYQVFSVPSFLAPERAALVEPVACVARGINRARAKAGDTVAVIGGGTMGLLHSILLTTKGCDVYLFDDDVATHGPVMSTGAHATGSVHSLSDPKLVERLTDGWGFDCIFCTRFGVRGIQGAIAAASRGARIVLYQSIPTPDLLSVGANFLHYREIELIGTIAQSADDVRNAIRTIVEHAARFDVLQVNLWPSSNAQEAFEQALDPRVNRVMLDFR
ncbi:medium chain dehydrogenase/reductase family protein [Rhizobium sp. CIAT894]|uniref:zinc-dependent alcohol dehydrogenase n=1 Tax=Rhizobium sp. CIAT894 TaxID=2020312 RepID=UPI00031D92D2